MPKSPDQAARVLRGTLNVPTLWPKTEENLFQALKDYVMAARSYSSLAPPADEESLPGIELDIALCYVDMRVSFTEVVRIVRDTGWPAQMVGLMGMLTPYPDVRQQMVQQTIEQLGYTDLISFGNDAAPSDQMGSDKTE